MSNEYWATCSKFVDHFMLNNEHFFGEDLCDFLHLTAVNGL